MCERKPATKYDWRNTQYELYASLHCLQVWISVLICELMH